MPYTTFGNTPRRYKLFFLNFIKQKVFCQHNHHNKKTYLFIKFSPYLFKKDVRSQPCKYICLTNIFFPVLIVKNINLTKNPLSNLQYCCFKNIHKLNQKFKCFYYSKTNNCSPRNLHVSSTFNICLLSVFRQIQLQKSTC